MSKMEEEAEQQQAAPGVRISGFVSAGVIQQGAKDDAASKDGDGNPPPPPPKKKKKHTHTHGCNRFYDLSYFPSLPSKPQQHCLLRNIYLLTCTGQVLSDLSIVC